MALSIGGRPANYRLGVPLKHTHTHTHTHETRVAERE